MSIYSIEGWQPNTPPTDSPDHQEQVDHPPDDAAVISAGLTRGDAYVAVYRQTGQRSWTKVFERWLSA